jgi:hypothetical protein
MMGPMRRVIGIVLALLVGFAGGYVVAADDPDESKLPDEELVLYEPVSMAFPIEGARFTDSFEINAEEGCDKEKLKQLLNADPHRKEAWLELQGITEAEFDSFVDRLQSAVLLEPTPVTNHGCFQEGEGECPFSLHSVLAAGTLVLVDPEQNNRPVVKCRCGNPLKEPRCPPNCDGRPSPSPTVSPTPPQTDPPRTDPPRTQPPTFTPVPTPRRTPPPTPTPCIPGSAAPNCPRTPPPNDPIPG